MINYVDYHASELIFYHFEQVFDTDYEIGNISGAYSKKKKKILDLTRDKPHAMSFQAQSDKLDELLDATPCCAF